MHGKLVCLLRNGMEAMRSIDYCHGDTIILRTRLRDDGDIEVTVVDSGCGVSEAVERKLFTLPVAAGESNDE